MSLLGRRTHILCCSSPVTHLSSPAFSHDIKFTVSSKAHTLYSKVRTGSTMWICESPSPKAFASTASPQCCGESLQQGGCKPLSCRDPLASLPGSPTYLCSLSPSVSNPRKPQSHPRSPPCTPPCLGLCVCTLRISCPVSPSQQQSPQRQTARLTTPGSPKAPDLTTRTEPALGSRASASAQAAATHAFPHLPLPASQPTNGQRLCSRSTG